MNLTLEPIKFSVKNLFNYFKTSETQVPEFYRQSNKLVVDKIVKGKNYTSQDVTALKEDLYSLEQLIESPEMDEYESYKNKIEKLTNKIAARAYIINDSIK